MSVQTRPYGSQPHLAALEIPSLWRSPSSGDLLRQGSEEVCDLLWGSRRLVVSRDFAGRRLSLLHGLGLGRRPGRSLPRRHLLPPSTRRAEAGDVGRPEADPEPLPRVSDDLLDLEGRVLREKFSGVCDGSRTVNPEAPPNLPDNAGADGGAAQLEPLLDGSLDLALGERLILFKMTVM